MIFIKKYDIIYIVNSKGMIYIRLWHQLLIPKLPRQQLLGQNRECAALRGRGWGRRHSVVNYVFTHSPYLLVAYHNLIMDEMVKRGYEPSPVWRDRDWRGAQLGHQEGWAKPEELNQIIYPEHNEEYLQECIENLAQKGIII